MQPTIDLAAASAAAHRLAAYAAHHRAPISARKWDHLAFDAERAADGCEASLASVQAAFDEDDCLADEMARPAHYTLGAV